MISQIFKKLINKSNNQIIFKTKIFNNFNNNNFKINNNFNFKNLNKKLKIIFVKNKNNKILCKIINGTKNKIIIFNFQIFCYPKKIIKLFNFKIMINKMIYPLKVNN
jgi:hypothetical protein